MLDNVLNRYKGMAAAWASVFTTHATILFGALAAISLIWTFGQMALRRADLGEFASEAIRFAVFCGCLLVAAHQRPGDRHWRSLKGLRSLGAQASGLPNNLAPSGIVDIGFDIFRQAMSNFRPAFLTPVDSALSSWFRWAS
jgi:type IV secretion system protein TrbL